MSKYLLLVSENIEVKKGGDQNGPYGGIVNPTQLSFEKDKKHELNRSTDVDAKKKEVNGLKYKENGFNQPQNTNHKRPQMKLNNQLDLENLNQSNRYYLIQFRFCNNYNFRANRTGVKHHATRDRINQR